MTSSPSLRCALCLRGLTMWHYGGQYPICPLCRGGPREEKHGPPRDPAQWEIHAGRNSGAARAAWEHWAAPRQPYDEDPPLTHFFHCWRFPDHYRCAVAMIEKLAEDCDRLLIRAAEAETRLERLTKPAEVT